MNQLKFIVFLALLMIPFLMKAQDKDISRLIESIVESQINSIDEQTDAALIIEDLEKLAENPLNVNSASPADFARLYLLNEIQISNLMDYLREFGPVYTIYELQTIEGFTPDLLQKMEPFIRFGPKEDKKTVGDSFSKISNQFLLRTTGTVQKAKGFLPNDEEITPYEGNQYRYFARYGFEAGSRFSAGMTAEKDPGEAFFSGSNKQGFDFYSGYISANINKTLQNITVGDFLVRSGQGLVIWQGYTTGKSENVLGISKNGQGIRPSTGVDENLFFRGATTTLNFGKANLSLFFSGKRDDGNLAGNDSLGFYVTSLQTSGYHRTGSEIADENSIRNTNFGGTFNYLFRNLKIGASFVRQQLNPPFIPAGELYNNYRFSGDKNLNGGVDYQFVSGKYQLFGEAAISKSGGKAVVQGVVINLNDQLGFSALYRHFDRNYQALWANTFAEGTNMSNESGLYLGTRLLPFKYVVLSAYSDFYHSEWINYSTAAPASGSDVLFQAAVNPTKYFDFYVRLKSEEKETKFIQDERYVNLPEKTNKLRIHFNYRKIQNITLKTRVEFSKYKGTAQENGWMIFQDFQYKPEKFPMSLSARIAFFNTDSYNSRIYTYENDLLYTFSVPAFYDKGFRSYLNFQYKITDKIDCWVKIANTSYTDKTVISSGYNEIQGNKRTELKFQLRIKI